MNELGDFDDHSAHGDVGEFIGEAAQTFIVVGEDDPCHEKQSAAAQGLSDVVRLAAVNPTHWCVQSGGSGDHSG